MADDFNTQVIDEFRANGGKVGCPFEGAPVVLLTTTGAKSGREFTSPLMYLPEGERVVIFASKGGAPTNPDWYHNLKKNPTVTIEVGTEKFEAEATEVTGAERDTLYAEQVSRYPGFGDYEKATTRVIPVIALTRK